MITIEQLKDVKERTAALERYLDIENKLVQVEEEQLRTQAPGFWDDAKKAEAQMRKSLHRHHGRRRHRRGICHVLQRPRLRGYRDRGP